MAQAPAVTARHAVPLPLPPVKGRAAPEAHSVATDHFARPAALASACLEDSNEQDLGAQKK
eukprot:CAMPEP_0175699838 /NCGR_PEP_ID=MMETSP0097-20121207/34678_1 /TAXON_ID=311494 /ORGANISM="Alexandrium monilatum, Strain CCMP3105" /LENGTH=60 /DNA_ID=CAMNT_0017007049 /DNA_START=190 /DNA_END=368 /DNA_ORIENTATION=+